jgi:hypothetical protein
MNFARPSTHGSPTRRLSQAALVSLAGAALALSLAACSGSGTVSANGATNPGSSGPASPATSTTVASSAAGGAAPVTASGGAAAVASGSAGSSSGSSVAAPAAAAGAVSADAATPTTSVVPPWDTTTTNSGAAVTPSAPARVTTPPRTLPATTPPFPTVVNEALDYGQLHSLTPEYGPINFGTDQIAGTMTPYVFTSTYETEVELVQGGDGTLVVTDTMPASNVVADFSALQYRSNADAVAHLDEELPSAPSPVGVAGVSGAQGGSANGDYVIAWHERGWTVTVTDSAGSPAAAGRAANAVAATLATTQLPPAPGVLAFNTDGSVYAGRASWVDGPVQIAVESPTVTQTLAVADAMRAWPRG